MKVETHGQDKSGLSNRVAARLDEIAPEIAALKARSARLSAVRLGAFAALLVGLGLAAFESPWFLLGLAAPGIAAFAAAFALHGKVLDRLGALEGESILLGERRERMRARRHQRQPLVPDPIRAEVLPGLRGDGEPEAFEVEPSVLDDLDLVGGPRSLYAFLDATSTVFGARRLLSMLRRPLLDPRGIRERQEAVAAAASAPGAIDRILEALLPLRGRDLSGALETIRGPSSLAGRRGLLAWANIAGTAAPVLLAWTAIDVRAGPLFIIAAIINLGTIALHVKLSNPARDRLLALGPLLEGLDRLREVLRAESLAPAAWRRASGALDAAEPRVRRLRRAIHFLELHDLGILFEVFNILTLWELRVLPVAEGVLRRGRKDLEAAALALGEAEALACLALPLFEQPGFALPEVIAEGPPRLEIEGLGHPLIEAERVVVNDLRLGPEGPIAIITGSNMAGKSTLLKATGMNLVLAQMGGPVEARSMRWTPLVLESDINVRDSLDDGKSYFAVEVERVAGIVRRAGQGGRILALLDEPFRGTNSAERQAIAMALLAHLRAAGGLYLVATHDLALARLESEVPGIGNFHFREEVDGGGMRFDYVLRRGPAPTRNAIRVLETRGYPETLVREARERLARGEAEERSDR
jgi:hypothetical protein